MSMFRTILVAADLSECSKASFRAACLIAREAETRVRVLHVSETKGPAPKHSDDAEATAADSQTQHDAWQREYVPAAPLRIDYRTRTGAPADEILREAEEIAADLIVLGTHGRTGLRRLFIGSVAEAVLRRAQRPVLAVRCLSPQHEFRQVQVVLHPTDFSDSTADALRVAREIAHDQGAHLALLHVALPPINADGMAIAPPDLTVPRQRLEALHARLAGPDLTFPIQTLLREDLNVASEIQRVCDDVAADLIVLGTHGRTGMRRLLMGSVAETVLRHSSRPVLIVKAAAPSTQAPASEPSTPETLES